MSTIEKFDPEKFRETAAERQRIIDSASTAPLPKTFPVNELAKRLHPDRQYMKIAKITQLDKETKCFRFVPDPARGTTECAYFKAGAYVNLYAEIGGRKVNRSYSISSSPKDALDGFYELTLRTVKDGLLSTYVLDNWKEGDEVELSGPFGSFDYSPIRDAKTVIGLAGGSGITPFLSMARALRDGTEDFALTLLFGSRTADTILYRDELDEIAKACPNFRVVHVLSDETRDGYEHGFITADLIRKYAPAGEPYSVFICGPQAMYSFVDKEIEKLGLERKYIRHELFGEIHDPHTKADYPGTNLDTVKITVKIRDTQRTVTGSVNDTVLQTLEKNGIVVPTRCRSGECGFCHSRLASGEVYMPKDMDGRRLADHKFGYIHPCATFPLSDLEVEVPADK